MIVISPENTDWRGDISGSSPSRHLTIILPARVSEFEHTVAGNTSPGKRMSPEEMKGVTSGISSGEFEQSGGFPDVLITGASDNADWCGDSSEDESGYAT